MGIFVLFANVFSGTVQISFGYIDPGSGSALITAIVGLFVAVGITIKTYWYKILSFFKIGKSSDDSEHDN